jgi:transposase InsO family protein
LISSGSLKGGKNASAETPAVQRYLREAKRLVIKNDTLYRTATLDGLPVSQLVIPESHRRIAIQGIHNDAGHQGKEKSLWLARQRFYWPGLEKDITQWVEHCDRCIRRKTPANRPFAELTPIQTSRPMELVSIDFLKLEPSKGGIENILVIVDHFTRFAQAIPCRNQTAATTAKALYEGFFRFYGFPEQLHSDQGRNFLSRTIQELCRIAGIRKSRTTPYHPMGNGGAERWNQTLLKMLGTLENHQKSDWKSYISPLVQAYNATKNDATGYAPHYLMFGWHPRLPVDAYLGTDPTEGHDGSHSSYASKLHQRLQYAYRAAAEEAGKLATKNKLIYDRGVKESKLEAGDQVLVRKVGLQGTNKLADKWDTDVYVVLEMPNSDIPVYRVQLQSRKGPIKTLHRNLLLPYRNIYQPAGDCVVPSSGKSSRKRTVKLPRGELHKQLPAKGNTTAPRSESSEVSDSSDSERANLYIPPHLRGLRPAKRQHPPQPREIPADTSVSEVTRFSNNLDLTLPQHRSVGSPRQTPDDKSAGTFSPTPQSSAAPTGYDSTLTQSRTEVPTVSEEHSDRTTEVSIEPSSATDVSAPPPVSPRPVRRRVPPQRYGEWVTPVGAGMSQDFEIFYV